MKKKAVHMLLTLLAGFASLFVLTACNYWAYQPEVPKDLLKKSAA